MYAVAWNFLLFADVGLDSFVKLCFRVNAGYRLTTEPARCEELLNRRRRLAFQGDQVKDRQHFSGHPPGDVLQRKSNVPCEPSRYTQRPYGR